MAWKNIEGSARDIWPRPRDTTTHPGCPVVVNERFCRERLLEMYENPGGDCYWVEGWIQVFLSFSENTCDLAYSVGRFAPFLG